MAYDLCCMEVDEPSRISLGEHAPISATVLLVENHAPVRGCLREVPNELGGRVSDAASAAEALARLEPSDRFLCKPFDMDTLAQVVLERAVGQDRP